LVKETDVLFIETWRVGESEDIDAVIE
jgi:hypothetical protein